MACVRLSFQFGAFEAAGATWVQHRGTCIGNQISPILSALPVLQTEGGSLAFHFFQCVFRCCTDY